ncbi:unnamed protein product [Allacma fusca]|uniref:Reverse transcriptase domain-containing protein n=1 Tax=Allacma fusca TaxID=39272 RepID=A0A8J2NQZ7_9HEXA|nr:unnamed protein product [Allacma fusca]
MDDYEVLKFRIKEVAITVEDYLFKQQVREIQNIEKKFADNSSNKLITEELVKEMITVLGNKTESNDNPRKVPSAKATVKIEDALSKKQAEDKLKYVHSFFTSKYSANDDSPGNINEYINRLNKINENDRTSMNRELTEVDFKNAIMKLQSNKSPGSDGLTSEFYQKYVDHFKTILLWLTNHSLENKSLPLSNRTGIISLIYKKGDPQSIGNYRPITLCNSDYKVIAICAKDRMMQAIPKLIGEYQTSNVPGRSIYDNLNFLRDAISEITSGAIISLDQESVFDNINREFGYACLDAMNFPPIIITIIKLLYNNNVVIVKVGELLTTPIKVLKGIKQGDPIASILFIICSEIFIKRLNDNLATVAAGPWGKMPNSYTSAYADDTHSC